MARSLNRSYRFFQLSQLASKTPVLKMDEVYKNNVKALFSPALRIIFTIPISVVRDIELKTNLESETGSSIQQMEIANFYS